jgi:hypothetical protein
VTTAPPSLFSTGQRLRRTPRRHGESSYRLLDQASSVVFERIRAVLEDWYSRWPGDGGDLRRRFCQDDVAQHLGAFWELYVHEALTSAAFEIEHHARNGSRSSRIDFCASRDSQWLLVEATVALPGSDAERARVVRAGAVYDEFDKTRSNHWLEVEIRGADRISPPVRRWREQLEEGLATSTGVVEWEGAAGAWRVRVTAVPRGPMDRAAHQNALRPCAVFPSSEASLDERPAPVLKALEAKRKQHASPAYPYVIAVLADVSVFASVKNPEICSEIEAPIAEFFADPDNRSVSAVVTVSGLRPWTVAKTSPILWLNPRAAKPLAHGRLPWPTAAEWQDGKRASPSLIGLPAEWPGPEDPFPFD